MRELFVSHMSHIARQKGKEKEKNEGFVQGKTIEKND